MRATPTGTRRKPTRFQPVSRGHEGLEDQGRVQIFPHLEPNPPKKRSDFRADERSGTNLAESAPIPDVTVDLNLESTRLDSALANTFPASDPLAMSLEPACRVRAEQSSDVEAIGTTIREAFAEAEHASGTEAEIVDALRAAGALTLSLVAQNHGEVIGHVAVSRVRIDGTPGWFGLGPLAVAPDHQRQGIGGALVRAALRRLRQRNAAGCVLVGDPKYYARFGFGPAAPLVFPGVPQEYFQAIDLNGPRPSGPVDYHDAFNAPT